MDTFVSGKYDAGFGSGQPGAGKKSHHGKKADHAKKAEKKKKSKSDPSAKLFKQAASLLNQAAQRLSSGAAGQSNPLGSLGGMNPLGAMGGLGMGGGYNPMQALGISQGLGNGFAQFAGNGGTNITNINYNFGGGSSNPFTANFASAFGGPSPCQQPMPMCQANAFSGAFAF